MSDKIFKWIESWLSTGPRSSSWSELGRKVIFEHTQIWTEASENVVKLSKNFTHRIRVHRYKSWSLSGTWNLLSTTEEPSENIVEVKSSDRFESISRTAVISIVSGALGCKREILLRSWRFLSLRLLAPRLGLWLCLCRSRSWRTQIFAHLPWLKFDFVVWLVVLVKWSEPFRSIKLKTFLVFPEYFFVVWLIVVIDRCLAFSLLKVSRLLLHYIISFDNLAAFASRAVWQRVRLAQVYHLWETQLTGETLELYWFHSILVVFVVVFVRHYN